MTQQGLSKQWTQTAHQHFLLWLMESHHREKLLQTEYLTIEFMKFLEAHLCKIISKFWNNCKLNLCFLWKQYYFILINDYCSFYDGAKGVSEKKNSPSPSSQEIQQKLSVFFFEEIKKIILHLPRRRPDHKQKIQKKIPSSPSSQEIQK